MKTIILCGGQGTRIRDVADNIPKPMIPIGNRPILWHIMKQYSHYGHNEFILCLGHKSEPIKEYFLNYEIKARDFSISLGTSSSPNFHTESDIPGWKITMAETGAKTMTGARVRKIKRYIGNDQLFMLTYGDGVSNIDINKLIAFHKDHGKIATITGVFPPGRFGVLGTDNNNMVTSFQEKPQAQQGMINGGFFVCDRKFFDYLDGDDTLTLEKEPMDALVRDRQLMVYSHQDFWQPMDTFREYSLLNDLYKTNKAPWKVWK